DPGGAAGHGAGGRGLSDALLGDGARPLKCAVPFFRFACPYWQRPRTVSGNPVMTVMLPFLRVQRSAVWSRPWWSLLLLLPLLAMADPAARQPYDLPPGALAPALYRFADIAGISVQAGAGLLDGKDCAGLRGDYTVDEGLRRLLAGTGLTARRASEAVYVIRAEQAQVLDQVDVSGGIGGSPAMALPVPYEGGQLASGGQVGMLGNKDYMDAPVNITSYTRETIDNLQARTVAEMVRNDPSVRNASGPGGMLDSFFIRGFAMNEGNSGEVSYNGVFGVAPNYRVLTGYAERVEVLKGPSTLLNGLSPNSSVGGTINVVPKRAQD